jgi:hypothetical protein
MRIPPAKCQSSGPPGPSRFDGDGVGVGGDLRDPYDAIPLVLHRREIEGYAAA